MPTRALGDGRSRRAGVEAEFGDVERVELEAIAVRLVALRRTGAEIAGRAGIVLALDRAFWRKARLRIAGAGGSDVALAGMSKIIQCQKPAPVGASGSNRLSAKLLAPAGAPDQTSAGERLPPAQPKRSPTCGSPTRAPGARSGLVSVSGSAPAAEAPMMSRRPPKPNSASP